MQPFPSLIQGADLGLNPCHLRVQDTGSPQFMTGRLATTWNYDKPKIARKVFLDFIKPDIPSLDHVTAFWALGNCSPTQSIAASYGQTITFFFFFADFWQNPTHLKQWACNYDCSVRLKIPYLLNHFSNLVSKNHNIVKVGAITWVPCLTTEMIYNQKYSPNCNC